MQFLNNLETDIAYRRWPKSVTEVLRPTFPGMLRQIAKNLFTFVSCLVGSRNSCPLKLYHPCRCPLVLCEWVCIPQRSHWRCKLIREIPEHVVCTTTQTPLMFACCTNRDSSISFRISVKLMSVRSVLFADNRTLSQLIYCKGSLLVVIQAH